MAYKDRAKKPEIPFRGYVDIKFDDAMKKEFRKWVATNPAVFDLLDEYGENSYRVSVTYDTENKCHQASMTNYDTHSENAGFVLVGRGSTTYLAILQCLYKESAIAKGSWIGFVTSRAADWD
jgi:hypothetical protein